MRRGLLICALTSLACSGVRSHRQIVPGEGPQIAVVTGLPTAVVVRGTISGVRDDFLIVHLQQADCFGTSKEHSPCVIPQSRRLDLYLTCLLSANDRAHLVRNPKRFARGQPVWTDAATRDESDPISHILELMVEQRDSCMFFMGTPGPVSTP